MPSLRFFSNDEENGIKPRSNKLLSDLESTKFERKFEPNNTLAYSSTNKKTLK